MQKLIKAAVFTGVLATAGAASAATTTTTFAVTATVATNCLVSATPLAFGTYAQGGGDLDQTSTVNVRCSNGTPFNVGLNPGATGGATVTTRRMVNGAKPAGLFAVLRCRSHDQLGRRPLAPTR